MRYSNYQQNEAILRTILIILLELDEKKVKFVTERNLEDVSPYDLEPLR